MQTFPKSCRWFTYWRILDEVPFSGSELVEVGSDAIKVSDYKQAQSKQFFFIYDVDSNWRSIIRLWHQKKKNIVFFFSYVFFSPARNRNRQPADDYGLLVADGSDSRRVNPLVWTEIITELNQTNANRTGRGRFFRTTPTLGLFLFDFFFVCICAGPWGVDTDVQYIKFLDYTNRYF